MSNSSDSRRLEALESNVTEIQGQMSELMSMMRQLTQTRTAGAGQHEEESGGTGRGAAHNPRGEPPTTPAAAPEGCRPLLKQAMVSQQSELEEGEALQRSELQQPGSSPFTTGLRQNQLTPDQCFQSEWAC